MTPDIRDEWNKHQSSFARRWRVTMVARKKFCFIGDCSDNQLRDKIEAASSIEKYREAMLKDCLLIEAALATDQTIISLDEIVRELFAQASPSVRELREIIWVNPDNIDEQPVEWLSRGARVEKKRKLGFRVK